ncbi:MAG TPA: hypothetical protein VMA74_09660 [Dyella sp.]|uniref:hypothetical protein n=1 Tax=Dyella sp. TaxID=1869338 RepID=UPI002B70CE7E|nr:hypothetical protein [Dyella sp.]HUB89980.1 hypothetical protein [Dyella sp.]
METRFVKAIALSFCLSSMYVATTLASTPDTPLERAALRDWVRQQSSSDGYLFECKGSDGKFFTTRLLGPDCVVHEQLGPYVVLSDTPKAGWRKVQATAQADFYLDNSSFSYIDAQAVPKPGAGVMAWLKIVYHQPRAVANTKNNEMFTTQITSLSYGCKHNMVDYGIAWLYGADGKLVGAYLPLTLVVQPQNPMAAALASFCKVGPT